MKSLRFILLVIILYSSSLPVYAQLSLGSNPQPATPQTAEMTRYGGHNVNLYTGRITISIPIGEYRDKDFTIPVSLEYNYNGMRPNEQAGECGLGWMLACGGMITREVVGTPDEGEGGTSHRSFDLFSPSGQMISTDILPFDNIPYDSLATYSTIVGQLLQSTDKPDNALTVAYEIGGRYYDASSDVYHFRMPGHSGSFFRNDDGTFTAFDTDGPCGTYRIEKTNAARTGNGYRSQIVITTGDGYQYFFGSLAEDDNFLERIWLSKEPGPDRGTIVAWRLRKIVSPGGRELTFSYLFKWDDPFRAVQGFSDDRWIFNSSGFVDQDISGTEVFTTYAPLEKVSAGDIVIQFHYSEKDALHSGLFLNGTGTHNLSPGLATRLLDSISCNNVSTQLAYTWNNQGNPYPFLSSVHTDGIGTWNMTYEGLSNGYFPPFWTISTDHWGYLNQTTTAACNRHTVDWSYVSDLGNNYAETEASNSRKRPDTTAVRLGILTSLHYPTGGNTSFSYEPNRYASVVDKRYSSSYLLQEFTESGIGPGLRVTRIENRDADGTITDARSFTYGNGRLLAPFRHKIQYGGILYDLYSPGTSFANVSMYYATTGGLHRPGSVLLEYPDVTETRLDGSRTAYTFTSWADRPDTMTDTYTRMLRVENASWGNIIGYVTSIPQLNYVNRILEPRSSLQHYRGLPLTVVDYPAGSNSPVQNVTTHYDLSEPAFREVFVNVGEAFARSRRYAGKAQALSQTTTTYYSPLSVSSTVSYGYNAAGQVCDERTALPDGDSLRTARTFPQDYPADAALSAMAADGFVDFPVTVVQLRRRSGSSDWDTTAAVRYIYAPYTNSLGNTSYAASSALRWKGSGLWQTEYTFLHDDEGNIIQQTDADGWSTSYVWNIPYGVSILIENATRQQVETSLALSPAVSISDTDAASERLRDRLTQARVTDFAYWHYGLPTRMTDPAGHTFIYEYDDNDRLLSVKDSVAGFLQQFCYNSATATGSQTITTPTGEVLDGEENWILQRTLLDSLGTSVMRDVTYYDGLGYPVQTIQVNASPLGGSIVTPVYYDSVRRDDARSYLPFVSSTGLARVADPFTAQQMWYAAQYSSEDGAAAYAVKTYEPSALNRVTASRRPGNIYASGSHDATRSYSSNTGVSVRKVTEGASSSSLSVNGYYPAGSLHCVTTVDEDGLTVQTFTDDLGRTVLERKTLSSTQKADTYYVYDGAGRLTWIITPEGSALLGTSTNWSIDDADAAAYCYRYTYDGLGRLTERRQPGRDAEYFVYDPAGRLVARQDGNLRAQDRWLLSRYNAFGEETARYLSVAGTLTFSGLTALFADRAEPPGVYAILGNRLIYSAQYGTYPTGAPSFTAVLNTVTENDIDSSNAGRLTYEKLANLATVASGTVQYVERAYYYDKRGRLRQQAESDPAGGTLHTSLQYDYAGNELRRYVAGTLGGATSDLDRAATYDNRNRLRTESAILGLKTAFVKHGYDALGRHLVDTLTSSGTAGIITDTYDIRSQLLTRTAKKGSTTLFQETLRYDSPIRGTAARYAGSISEVMTLQGSTRNTYGFTYDAAGRLTTAKRFTGTSGTSSSAAYTERNITYNRNGALLALQRYGSSASTPQDDYSYTYSGPLLTGVTGKDSGTNLTAAFSHDGNGNTTADGRANLTFTYNLLNLPETVTSGNTQMATYHWLADGTKYRVDDANGNGVIYAGDLTYAVTVSGGNTTYALESAEASADGTARFLNAGGTTMNAYYTIRDHLGSVRTIVNASGTVVERNDYYPFGARTTFGASYPTLASNRQKFSGKEEQTAVAGSTLPYLDFGARMYDAKLVRWNTYDPMAEKYYEINPYVYCAGDPVNFVDPSGTDILLKEIAEYKNIIPEYAYSRALDGDYGPYSINAYYNDKDEIVGYSAVKFVKSGNDRQARFDYIMTDPADLELFSKNVSVFSAAADLIYASGELNHGMLSLISDYKARGLAMLWDEALSNPVYWMTIGSSLAGSCLMHQEIVYRVYGGKSHQMGWSWTPVNPETVTNYRNAAGLPNVNTGEYIAIGSVRRNSILLTRPALPLDGNSGGLKEYIINPSKVKILNVQKAKKKY